jgi:hypothetical protein
MNKDLRAELMRRCDEEQKLRTEWIDKQDDKAFAERVIENDRQNTTWLEGVVDTHGWLGKSLVGKDGAKAIFLLVQHSPNLAFQQKCLPLLEAAVQKKQADLQDLAYLTDRVLLAEGKKQLYGTQGMHTDNGIVPSPIEDEANVDARRKALKMMPLAKYFAMMNEFYKTQQGK